MKPEIETTKQTKEEKAGVREFDTKSNPTYFAIADGWHNKQVQFRLKVRKSGKFTNHTLEGDFHQNFQKAFKIDDAIRQFLIANGGINKFYKGVLVEGISQDTGRHWLGVDVILKDNFRERFFFEWADLHTLEIFGIVKSMQVK